MNYLREQEKSGLWVGDRVRVIRKAKTHESGWRNSWVSPMDDTVGKIGTVIEVGYDTGIKIKFSRISSTYGYPYFVLQKISSDVRVKRSRSGLKVPAFMVCFCGES